MKHLFCVLILLLFHQSIISAQATLEIDGPYPTANQDEYFYSVITTGLEQVESMQGSFSWNGSNMTFLRTDEHNITNLGSGNFNNASPGTLRFVWDEGSGGTINIIPSTTVFNIYVSSQNPGSICLSEIPMKLEIFSSTLGVLDVTIIDECRPSDAAIVVDGPNPTGQKDEYYYDIKGYELDDIKSIRIPFSWDSGLMTFDRVDDFNLLELDATKFDFSVADTLLLDWDLAGGGTVDIPDNETIFRVYFISTNPVNFCVDRSPSKNYVFNSAKELNIDYIDKCSSTSGRVLSSWFDCRDGSKNDEVVLDYYVAGFTDINSFQYTITWDIAEWKYLDVTFSTDVLENFNEVNLGLSKAGEGEIRVSWFDLSLDGESIPDFTILYSLLFEQLVDNPSDISISSNPLAIEIMDVNFEEMILDHRTCSQRKFALVTGVVNLDEDGDCLSDSIEKKPAHWIVEAWDKNGLTNRTMTGGFGEYSLFVDSGDYTIKVIPYNDIWIACEETVDVSLVNEWQTEVVDFVFNTSFDCPRMRVDVSNGILRRCFDNLFYLSYINEGGTTANDVYVDIELDTFMSMVSATVPYTNPLPNIFRFDIGEVKPFEKRKLTFTAKVECIGTTIGQTHCVEAHIYPDTLCEEIKTLWSGASLEVNANCKGDSVHFTIINTGTADMTNALEYIVVEDDISFFTGPYNLVKDEVMNIAWYANGKTLRLIAEQEEHHPGRSKPTVAIEGCNLISGGTVSLGEINKFGEDDEDLFIDILCKESRGSHDPNDKVGSPEGWGAENFIPFEQELTYTIRFQNTGNDTAFRVVVKDNIAEELDVNSLRLSNSSHDVEMSLTGRTIQFDFRNILLPDSMTNNELSQGLVEYKIRPVKDLNQGIRINNDAGIYFDYNEPIITNTTEHVVGIYVITNVYEPFDKSWLNLTMYPNPTVDMVFIDLQDVAVVAGTELRVLNIYGQRVIRQSVNQSSLSISTGALPRGQYLLQFVTRGEVHSTSKLIKN